MRNAFAAELTELARRDPRVVLLSGDIGNRLFDPFKNECAERFFNCGVAEANMMGVAAGMAMSGMRPVVYTIVPFVTTRCLEQIRIDVCYHAQPVTIVGVGGGLSYASLGSTHHACEDVGLLRLLPGMTIVCPGDAAEVRVGLRAALQHDGPVYLRLGKKGEPRVHEQDPPLEIGRSLPVRSGNDVALLAVGHVLPLALGAADILAERGISARVDSFHTVKPLDEECLADVFAHYRLVSVIEEHSVIGGAASAVAEWLARRSGTSARFLPFGVDDRFLHRTGSVAYLRHLVGLEPDVIAAKVEAALEV